jgi:hypothetical protein
MTDTTARAPAVFVPVPCRRPARVGPVKHCPACHTELDGGPILFDCPTCEHAVRAADVDTEFHTPVRAAA